MRMTTRTSPGPRGAQSFGDSAVSWPSDQARLVNERFRARRDSHADSCFVALCECGRPGCQAGIELTVAEYDAIRRNVDSYIVVVGHESSSHAAVRSTERYLLVTDPRLQAGSRPVGSRRPA
jgi:hypothetical protein